MLESAIKTNEMPRKHETSRLAALHALDILDTPPEAPYDSITQLVAELFGADSAVIAFGDETRVWIKSFWGDAVREIPRASSIFELVLARTALSQSAPLPRSPLPQPEIAFPKPHNGLCRQRPNPIIRR